MARFTNIFIDKLSSHIQINNLGVAVNTEKVRKDTEKDQKDRKYSE